MQRIMLLLFKSTDFFFVCINNYVWILGLMIQHISAILDSTASEHLTCLIILIVQQRFNLSQNL